MWYIASKFSSNTLAGNAYYPVQDWLKGSNLTASVYRLQIRGVSHVVIAGESETTPAVVADMCTMLKKHNGQITAIPQNTLEAIAERREMRIHDAEAHGDKLWAETHNPVSYDTLPPAMLPGTTFTNLGDMGTQKSTEIVDKAFLEKIKDKPFIIAYQAYREKSAEYEWKQLIEQNNLSRFEIDKVQHFYASDVVSHINKINNQKLRRAKKYLFTPSALSLHAGVIDRNLEAHQVQARSMHTWIECYQEQTSPYGAMRAMFFSNAFPLEEIEAVAGNDAELFEHLTGTFSPHNGRWGLEVIDDTYNPIFDFTYDTARSAWIFLPSHRCPHGECKYPEAHDLQSVMFYESMAVCDPCQYCVDACGYYAHWLLTALAIIDGEYALSPDEQPFPSQTMEYTATVDQTVGKGKNKRKIKKDITRSVDYTIVTYDASRKRALTPDETQEVERARVKNWLVTTPDGDIIWARKQIKGYARKYPVHKDGTRHAGTVQVKSFVKNRVPMLRTPRRQTITKVTASSQTIPPTNP